VDSHFPHFPHGADSGTHGCTQISFGTIGLSVGLSFLVYGFGAFFQFLPFGSISSLLLIYGFPISLIGAALQYAKLDPVPCLSYEKAVALRDTQATAIQLQVHPCAVRRKPTLAALPRGQARSIPSAENEY
jgi:hypothetical protein